MSPKVYIYDFSNNGFKEESKLSDGAVCEYLAIEFSNSEAILTMSGIPEFQIIIWYQKFKFFALINELIKNSFI